MVKFEDLIGKFVIVALLVLGLFTFIIITQSDNGAIDPLADNSIFNDSFNDLITSIDESTEDSQEKYDVFNSEEPKGTLSIVLVAIVSVGKTFTNMVFTFFAAVVQLPLIVLGIDQSIYNLILTWLIIVAIVSAWVLYKFG